MKNEITNRIVRHGRDFSIIVAIIMLMFYTVSCNNDEETLSNTQYLTSSPWVLGSVNSGDATLDAGYIAFLSNATLTFTAAGTYTFTFLNDPDSNGSGTWEFNADETKITLDKGSADEEDWTVLTLNSSQFKFSFLDSEFDVTVEITLNH